jgi:hypothetical protein
MATAERIAASAMAVNLTVFMAVLLGGETGLRSRAASTPGQVLLRTLARDGFTPRRLF